RAAPASAGGSGTLPALPSSRSSLLRQQRGTHRHRDERSDPSVRPTCRHACSPRCAPSGRLSLEVHPSDNAGSRSWRGTASGKCRGGVNNGGDRCRSGIEARTRTLTADPASDTIAPMRLALSLLLLVSL